VQPSSGYSSPRQRAISTGLTSVNLFEHRRTETRPFFCSMSLSKTMVTLYAVCIQLQGADTYYQELEDKVIGRKDRLPMNMHAHTHTHRMQLHF